MLDQKKPGRIRVNAVVRKLFCNFKGITLLYFNDTFNIVVVSIDSCIICILTFLRVIYKYEQITEVYVKTKC